MRAQKEITEQMSHLAETMHTPGPWFTNTDNPDGVVYRVQKTGPNTAKYVTVARDCSADDARLIAAAPELDVAAGLAITALAFAAESYQRAGDELAFAQTMSAKNALIAAQKKARDGDQITFINPTSAAIAAAKRGV